MRTEARQKDAELWMCESIEMEENTRRILIKFFTSNPRVLGMKDTIEGERGTLLSRGISKRN
jgi:hypothetical protein